MADFYVIEKERLHMFMIDQACAPGTHPDIVQRRRQQIVTKLDDMDRGLLPVAVVAVVPRDVQLYRLRKDEDG